MYQPSLLIELHYLPCVAYFSYLKYYDKVIIDVESGFKKQTYRNRCMIRGANKIQNLTIPIRKTISQKFSEVEIDYNQKWLNQHRRSIQSAYGKAPFYEYYQEEFFRIFSMRHSRLMDLNVALLTKCLECLELDIKMQFMHEVDNLQNMPIIDAREEIHPKKTLPSKSPFYPQKYFQVFGKDFDENLSVIDLIFCEGPGAKRIIENSILPIDKFDK